VNALDLVRRAGPVDLRSVGRDPMLVWIPLLPLFFALLIRYVAPALGHWLLAEHGFDLVLYHPLLMSSFLLLVPTVAGMMGGFMLLDERDERTLMAVRVTPVPLEAYLAYRVGVPTAIGLALSLAVYPIAGLVPLPYPHLLATAALAALTAPLVMLFLAAFAENKVTGFALVKLLNVLLLIPIVAYFIPGTWQYVAGVIPSFWALKAFWLATDGAAYLPVIIGGVAAHLLVGWLLLARFRRTLARA